MNIALIKQELTAHVHFAFNACKLSNVLNFQTEMDVKGQYSLTIYCVSGIPFSSNKRMEA
ncbi:hypothetical protein BB048_24145 [Vibrio parahaemolyticus]|nr:hypothetical protein BBM44_18185 [Vibrio parahaemolyticus]OHX40355.1 hypothetical protein BB048_24145 [Vibrio parahaemolyticus]